VIVENTEFDPCVPGPLIASVEEGPPAPTVTGYVVAVTVKPVEETIGEAEWGEAKDESFDSL
jgi:hypothetical protein